MDYYWYGFGQYKKGGKEKDFFIPWLTGSGSFRADVFRRNTGI